MSISKSHRLGLLVLGLAVVLAVPAWADKSDVTVKNESSFAIHHMFLSPVDTEEWGPDQLGKHVIPPGGSYELTDIPCADYHLKLVDEDGDECVLTLPELCGEDEEWSFDDEALLACEGFGDEE